MRMFGNTVTYPTVRRPVPAEISAVRNKTPESGRVDLQFCIDLNHGLIIDFHTFRAETAEKTAILFDPDPADTDLFPVRRIAQFQDPFR